MSIFDGTTLISAQTYYGQPVTFTTALSAGSHQLRAVVPSYQGYTASSGTYTEIISAAGGGQFSAGTNYLAAPAGTPAETGSSAMIAADFNRDGYTDLAVTGLAGNSVTLFLGTGTGIFTDPLTTPLEYAPGGMVAFQSDIYGNIGLAITDAPDSMIVLSAYSASGFSNPDALDGIPVGSAPVAIASADFNGDGAPDFVSANSGSNNVSLVLSAGSIGNGMQTPFNIAAGNYPDAVVACDFNRDGNADFAVANRDSGNVLVFLGNGDGTFQAPITVGTGNGPTAVITADFNGDGKADLAVASSLNGQIAILLGNGDGTFRSGATVMAGARLTGIVAGDFTGTGKQGLAAATGTGVTVFPGNGDGTLGAPSSYSALAGAAGLAYGNFSLDGRMDLAGAFPARNSIELLLNGAPTSAVLNASPANVVAGAQVTLTLSVTPAAAFGWFTIYDGAAPLGSGYLSGGTAVFRTSALTAGSHQLTARFVGGPGYNSSLAQTVSYTAAPVAAIGLSAPLQQKSFQQSDISGCRGFQQRWQGRFSFLGEWFNRASGQGRRDIPRDRDGCVWRGCPGGQGGF